MANAVLDASALIAFIRNEPGADRVAEALAGACISAVNLAETIGKMVAYGKPLDDTAHQIERLRIPVIPFDAAHAKTAASLWKSTRAGGLSLGDRACLVLGLTLGSPVLTADGKWRELDVGVVVELIR